MPVKDYDQLFIGGKWVAPEGTDTIEVISPSTEEVIARSPTPRRPTSTRPSPPPARPSTTGPGRTWPRPSGGRSSPRWATPSPPR